MSTAEMIVLPLTVLAALVVVLTRLRLGRSHPGVLLHLHTAAGLIGFVVWLTFLLAPATSPWGDPLVGIVGLGCWWAVAVVGLLLLVRWVPGGTRSSGKRAARTGPMAADTWSRGPWLSLLAHLGMVAAVAYFTIAYLFTQV